MRVRVPFLVVSGYYEYEVDTPKLDNARDMIRNGQAEFVGLSITDCKLNLDAMREHEQSDCCLSTPAGGDSAEVSGNPEVLDSDGAEKEKSC